MQHLRTITSMEEDFKALGIIPNNDGYDALVKDLTEEIGQYNSLMAPVRKFEEEKTAELDAIKNATREAMKVRKSGNIQQASDLEKKRDEMIKKAKGLGYGQDAEDAATEVEGEQVESEEMEEASLEVKPHPEDVEDLDPEQEKFVKDRFAQAGSKESEERGNLKDQVKSLWLKGKSPKEIEKELGVMIDLSQSQMGETHSDIMSGHFEVEKKNEDIEESREEQFWNVVVVRNGEKSVVNKKPLSKKDAEELFRDMQRADIPSVNLIDMEPVVDGYVNLGGARVKDDEESVLKHFQKAYPNVKKVYKSKAGVWHPDFEDGKKMYETKEEDIAFDAWLKKRNELQANYDAASKSLKAITGDNKGGITPDSIKATKEFKDAKAASRKAFEALRDFNAKSPKEYMKKGSKIHQEQDDSEYSGVLSDIGLEPTNTGGGTMLLGKDIGNDWYVYVSDSDTGDMPDENTKNFEVGFYHDELKPSGEYAHKVSKEKAIELIKQREKSLLGESTELSEGIKAQRLKKMKPADKAKARRAYRKQKSKISRKLKKLRKKSSYKRRKAKLKKLKKGKKAGARRRLVLAGLGNIGQLAESLLKNISVLQEEKMTQEQFLEAFGSIENMANTMCKKYANLISMIEEDEIDLDYVGQEWDELDDFQDEGDDIEVDDEDLGHVGQEWDELEDFDEPGEDVEDEYEDENEKDYVGDVEESQNLMNLRCLVEDIRSTREHLSNGKRMDMKQTVSEMTQALARMMKTYVQEAFAYVGDDEPEAEKQKPEAAEKGNKYVGDDAPNAEKQKPEAAMSGNKYVGEEPNAEKQKPAATLKGSKYVGQDNVDAEKAKPVTPKQNKYVGKDEPEEDNDKPAEPESVSGKHVGEKPYGTAQAGKVVPVLESEDGFEKRVETVYLDYKVGMDIEKEIKKECPWVKVWTNVGDYGEAFLCFESDADYKKWLKRTGGKEESVLESEQGISIDDFKKQAEAAGFEAKNISAGTPDERTHPWHKMTKGDMTIELNYAADKKTVLSVDLWIGNKKKWLTPKAALAYIESLK